MTKRGKYDFIIRNTKTKTIEYIFKDFKLNEIDEFCSAYKSPIDCMIALSKERNKDFDGVFEILNYKGYNCQVFFGNEILKIASLNTYKGKDSYGNDRLKIEKQEKIKETMDRFTDILATNEGRAFCETNSGKSCLPNGLLSKFIRFSSLKEKNKTGLDSSEQVSEMNELLSEISKDGYVYKNFRGIVVFLERYSKQNKYHKNNKKNDSRTYSNIKSMPQYSSKDKFTEAQRYNMYCEDAIGKEEFLSEEEYAMMNDTPDDDCIDYKVKRK